MSRTTRRVLAYVAVGLTVVVVDIVAVECSRHRGRRLPAPARPVVAPHGHHAEPRHSEPSPVDAPTPPAATFDEPTRTGAAGEDWRTVRGANTMPR
jgi:hypothetical protein